MFLFVIVMLHQAPLIIFLDAKLKLLLKDQIKIHWHCDGDDHTWFCCIKYAINFHFSPKMINNTIFLISLCVTLILINFVKYHLNPKRYALPKGCPKTLHFFLDDRIFDDLSKMKSFLVLSIALCFSRAAVDHTCYSFGPRVDCGIVGTTEEQCRASGCCWAPTTDFEDAPPIDLPWCFKSNNLASYSSPSKISKKSGSFDTTLQLDVSSLPELGTDLRTLKATASEVAPGIVRFRLTDNTQQRWEVPPSLYPEESLAGGGTGYYYYHDDDDDMDAQADDSAIKIEMDEDPFAFRVFQNSSSSSTVLWNSTDLRLVFKEQYIELSTWMDSSVTLYGAGTRASSTLHLIRNGVPRALWNQDVGPTFREHNSYGSHPFILALSSSGESWGFFLLSSNGMDIVPAPDRVSWRIIGGMVDIFVLTGD